MTGLLIVGVWLVLALLAVVLVRGGSRKPTPVPVSLDEHAASAGIQQAPADVIAACDLALWDLEFAPGVSS